MVLKTTSQLNFLNDVILQTFHSRLLNKKTKHYFLFEFINIQPANTGEFMKKKTRYRVSFVNATSRCHVLGVETHV